MLQNLHIPCTIRAAMHALGPQTDCVYAEGVQVVKAEPSILNQEAAQAKAAA